MRAKPAFFEAIRKAASENWDILEQRPDLAGPWHQLFMQVQSPRHVLSELLQNADDAGASDASVDIEDGCFSFSHNGEDFSEEHFRSLCRFGYSNKRVLHTIGFRGIGFKSTFSLGNRVYLVSPTLSVSFERRRFTEPMWVDRDEPPAQHTEVHVRIEDERRMQEVQENLAEWLQSPLSLLFFKNIRSLRVRGVEIRWEEVRPGPVRNSHWMALSSNRSLECLIVCSDPEPFPDEAIAEIRQERMAPEKDDSEYPPCRVDLVLNAKGRLYVVLPTGVMTSLPFACNAPFIQDPARVKIKDPETSPTNRWLLERIGKLAAGVMMQWLHNERLGPAMRAKAYDLLPERDISGEPLEVSVTQSVHRALQDAVDGQDILLTQQGQMKQANQAVALPEDLLDIWPDGDTVSCFDTHGRAPLSREVSEKNLKKLRQYDLVATISDSAVLSILSRQSLPVPDTWARLLTLWAYLEPSITRFRANQNYNLSEPKQPLRIVPVQGEATLGTADRVARLGGKDLLQSKSDWEFLSDYLKFVDPDWLHYLDDQVKSIENRVHDRQVDRIQSALTMLKALGIAAASDARRILEIVAATFFLQGLPSLPSCVRLAQIAAKLNTDSGKILKFFTKEMSLLSAADGILFDRHGELEYLLADDQAKSRLLHPDYTRHFGSCTREEWMEWVSSGRSGLLTFLPLPEARISIYGRKNLERVLSVRGVEKPSYRYRTERFFIEDRDYSQEQWRHWEALAKTDDKLWSKILTKILEQSRTYWSNAVEARVIQVATNGSESTIVSGLTSAWVLKFRELPCLTDSRGFIHKPIDLMLRTSETESFRDVEPFIDAKIDKEANRALLVLLGVRDVPTGPGRILDALRALSRSEKPPVHEVEKWYLRLDELIHHCKTEVFSEIIAAFRNEKILLTDNGRWETSHGVFLEASEEDLPDTEVIRESVRDLQLWRRLGIADRPSAERMMGWLCGLPVNTVLQTAGVRRIKGLLKRFPGRIWQETGYWLNLSGQWVSVNDLKYSISMGSLFQYGHLYESVKAVTADFRDLDLKSLEQPPFYTVPALGRHVQERFNRPARDHGRSEVKPWLRRLGQELTRVILTDDAETERVRALAAELAESRWQTVSDIETIPYIDGVPAGTPRRVKVIWRDKEIYVEPMSSARLAQPLAQELGKPFARQDVTDAIKTCFEREPAFVSEYLEDNFKLAESVSLMPDDVNEYDTAGTGLSKADNETGDTSQAPLVEQAEDFSKIDELVDKIFGMTGNNAVEQTESAVELGVNQDMSESTPEQVSAEPRKKSQKVSRPAIIELYALAKGYAKNGEQGYRHPNGSVILKNDGGAFQWEMYDSAGEVIRYLWTKDHCLEEQPLEIKAEVWGMIDQHPDTHALILKDHAGEPVEIPGSRLQSMHSSGEIRLYPATYRLVHRED